MVQGTRVKKSLSAVARKRNAARVLRAEIRQLKEEKVALETERRELRLENQQLTDAMLRMSEAGDRRDKRLRAQEEKIRELERVAHHDALTGLLDRLGMEIALTKTIKNITREHRKGVLVYLDLDKFKLVNDVCNHDTGDQVLVSIGTVLRDRLRPTDLISRVGGDEFLVFLQNADLDIAKKIVGEIQDRVRAITVDHKSIPTLMRVAKRESVIDFSAGYKLVEEGDGSSFATLMKEAEKDVPKFHARRALE